MNLVAAFVGMAAMAVLLGCLAAVVYGALTHSVEVPPR